MSLFGAASTTAPQTSGGLFGASNTQQQPAGGSLFGAPAQQATNTNTLFGNSTAGATTTNTGGGGLFGQTNTATQGTMGGGLFGGGQQQQQPAAGGGLFGNTQTQPATTGGSLFGAPTQPAATSGGLFGASTQQTQPATTGGGLFGASTQPAAAGGSLFGAPITTQPATGGGLFGASTTQTQPAIGGGLFGASTSTQPATGGSLFGASTAQQPQQQGGGGLFGGGGGVGSKPGLNINTSTNATGTAPATTSLFGGGAFGQSQAQQPPTSASLFSQPKPSLFGQSTTAATGSMNTNIFGGGNTSTLGTSALGAPGQTGGFGSSILGRTAAGPVQPQDAQSQHLLLQQRIQGVYNAWNPASPQCRFQVRRLSLRPKLPTRNYDGMEHLQRTMGKSKKRKPRSIMVGVLLGSFTPSDQGTNCLIGAFSFVPVFATGFDDLRARVDAQSAQSEKLKQRLTDMKKRIDALAERHALSNVSRLQRAAAQQIQVAQRLLAFAQHLHLLIPAVRSSAIRPEEERLRGQLEEVEEEIRRGRLAGKLNELWALIGAVAAAADRGRGGEGSGGDWVVVDEEGLAHITQLSFGASANGHPADIIRSTGGARASDEGAAEDTEGFRRDSCHAGWGGGRAEFVFGYVGVGEHFPGEFTSMM
ncbi:hypothetical protein C0991_008261 [Blastosporella zonata]|nr:hypothetical protein C0991_008261 [Blastosporella zonata]